MERIERQNRRMKGAGALLLALAGFALLMGQTKEGQPPPAPGAQAGQARTLEADIVSTRRFVIKDSNGNVRFFMTTMPDGSPSLELRTGDGKTRMSLTSTDGGVAEVKLNDSNGLSHASIVVGPDGASALELRDKDRKVVFKAPEKPGETPAGK
ncbi:MAG TPA: hypothetical protein VGM03_20885 [Phycisphaerae bacterium]